MRFMKKETKSFTRESGLIMNEKIVFKLISINLFRRTDKKHFRGANPP